jgi:hypothetical protein
MAEEIETIYDQLNLLVQLMQAAKEQLEKGGISDSSSDTLYKLAFSAATDGRKLDYFARKEAEDKKRPPQRSSYGDRGSSQRGSYQRYER